MTCPLCHSNTTTFIANFIPYKDKAWEFPVYDCEHCLSRFALRNEEINYHELLHEEQSQSTYQPHYQLAKKVADLIKRKELGNCENYLRANNFMHGEIIDFIEQQPTKNIKVLELGCSSGYLTAFLNAKGIETYGSDISNSAINKAKALFPEYADRFSKSPLHSSYDVIFHKGVISCVDDPVGFANYNIELLKPGGRLIFNMSSVESARKLTEIWASTPPPDVIYLFHDQTLKYLVNQDNKHQIVVTKHLDYFLLFKKYISLFTGKSFNKYPRTFHRSYESFTKNSAFSKFLVSLIAFKMKFLVKARLIKTIDEDFGTVVKLTKGHE